MRFLILAADGYGHRPVARYFHETSTTTPPFQPLVNGIDLALLIAHPDVYMQTGHSTSSRALTLAEFRTLALASLGGALEFYDFVTFVFFTALIGKLFFSAGLPDWMRQLQTFGIFAAGYLARPLGGVVMAHFGDIHGPKRMFTLSILLMAIPTLLIGCLPTYHAAGNPRAASLDELKAAADPPRMSSSPTRSETPRPVVTPSSSSQARST